MHPEGFKYTPDTGFEDTPASKTDLETAARWDRVAQSRKHIGIARLKSN